MSVETTLEHEAFILVLSSPSGAGKTALANKLVECDNNFVLSVSATTRPPREGEVDGLDYFFVDDKNFESLVSNNKLLEYAKVFSHRYGTIAENIYKYLEKGKDVLFDIDWQGAEKLKNNEQLFPQLVTVFILPPSMSELERRLKFRALDSLESVQKRLNGAERDISHWKNYDYVLINDDFENCFKKICSIVDAERLKRKRQIGISKFVDSLFENTN